ncbi:MAG: PQQ-binding-like beta-propeller repeat protein [Dehalococcoidales bacterium]|nr:PQQ-binding-like beta-propeller repeat protein [Dehalococcoidales bacterium]
MEKTVKTNNKNKTVGLIALLAAVIITIALFGFSCVSGLVPIGWSGGVESDGFMWVGSLEGRLVRINLADSSVLKTPDKLEYPQQTGLFGCSAASSCGGGASRVPVYATPAVSGNLCYIAGYNGKIYAYNTTDLATRWIYPWDRYLEAFVGGIVIGDNKLYVGCSDGYVYALDTVTGTEVGKYQTDDKIWGTPTLADNILYIGSFDKKLYALNADDLTLKWTFLTEGSIFSKPLVENGTVYIGSFDRNLYALNVADGTLKWKFMAGNWFWAQPVIVDGTIYAGCLDGFVYILDAATGAEVASPIPLNSALASTPVIYGNYIIFAAHDGFVYKIDRDTLEPVLIASFESSIDGPLALYEGIIYLQTNDAVLQRIDPETGALLPPIILVTQ